MQMPKSSHNGVIQIYTYIKYSSPPLLHRGWSSVRYFLEDPECLSFFLTGGVNLCVGVCPMWMCVKLLHISVICLVCFVLLTLCK